MSDHPELKKLRGFIAHSEEQYSQNNIVFSYYLKAYACQKLCQRMQEMQQQGENVIQIQSVVSQWFSELEKIRQSGQVNTEKKEQYYSDMKNFTLKLFLDADNEERQGKANKFTMKNFETASRFFEALTIFGKSDKDIDEKSFFKLLIYF